MSNFEISWLHSGLAVLSEDQTVLDSVPLTESLILLHHRRLPSEAHRADDVRHVGQDGLTLGDSQSLPLPGPRLLVPAAPGLHLQGVVAGDQVVHGLVR